MLIPRISGEDIPDSIYKLRNLTTLYLRFNRIKNVSEDIRNLEKLTMLSLRENKIKNLPRAIGCLVHLDILDISHNHLENLPAEIGLCKNLSALDLQHNELESLPVTIGDLVSLQRLGLRYNRLTSIPESLKNCKSSKKDFKVSILTKVLFLGVHLEEFNIEGNSVTELEVSRSFQYCRRYFFIFSCLFFQGILPSFTLLNSITLSRNSFVSFPAGGKNKKLFFVSPN